MADGEIKNLLSMGTNKVFQDLAYNIAYSELYNELAKKKASILMKVI